MHTSVCATGMSTPENPRMHLSAGSGRGAERLGLAALEFLFYTHRCAQQVYIYTPVLAAGPYTHIVVRNWCI